METNDTASQNSEEAKNAEGSASTPEKTEEHAQLQRFVGRWEGEGTLGDDGAPPTTVVDEYEALPGGFFLVGRGRMDVQGKPLVSAQLIGFDPDEGVFRYRQVDNGGFERLYLGHNDGNTWRFDGAHERATYVFESDTVLRIHWEQTQDGKSWKTLCRLRTRRVGAPRSTQV